MKPTCYALLLLAASTLLPACQEESDQCPQPELPKRCLLKPDPGVCNAAMPRYYYDPVDKRCKEFIWGGCGGIVPFQTLQECKDCGGEEPSTTNNPS
ncbi:BPTI/Kunitz domain-containing protein [Hymenobacter sp. B81]|uniref:BPTI/Kunitz domain-containing protein n=1 Tax=Hymenobacter sp. B81 TaxID=3344878 RepID=UPI0037DD06E6